MTTKIYDNSQMNYNLYKQKIHLDQYFKSVSYFFTRKHIKDGFSFLDIGGASGGFAKAVQNDVAQIHPTIIDPEKVSIAAGKNMYPDYNFIEGYYPESLGVHDKFDVVSMQGLFPQLPNWKDALINMSNMANYYINFSCVLRLSGATVIDKDVSYFYYLDTNERVHQVVHNIYEIINFLCLFEMRAKKIMFYGYHTEVGGHNFRCLPNKEQIKGNFMIELFANPEDNPPRWGGQVGTNNKEYKFYCPEIDIVIDEEPFDVR